MAIIHQLSDNLANLIAAGEVVERPSGIIKELIENSIDAKATRIEVTTSNGGLLKIVVSDNGCGMDKDDAVKCFDRHATSKISNNDDLWSIKSLGFRGEALPSIASVSKVELITNCGNDGYKVNNHYGEIVEVIPMACNKGTSISITNLFYKTPARLKYLKSENYEMAVIQDVVYKFALGNPNISFRLINNNKEILKTSGLNDLSEVISIIYGRDCYKNAFKFDFEDFDYKISGVALLPQINRANKNYIHIFINQRMIKSFRINKAIINAYNSYMDHSRYPIIIINIKMDEQLVDVNVHPSKWEVRLSKQTQLEYLISDGLKKALDNVMRANYVTKTSLSTDKHFNDAQTLDVDKVEEINNQINNVSKNDNVDTSSIINVNNDINTMKNINNNSIQQSHSIHDEAIKDFFERKDNVDKKIDINNVISVDNNEEIVESYQHNNQINVSNPIINTDIITVKADDIFPINYQVKEQKLEYASENETYKQKQFDLNQLDVDGEILNSDVDNKFPNLSVIGQMHGKYIICSSDDGLYIIDQHAAQERYNYERIQKVLDTKSFHTDLLIPITLNATAMCINQLAELNQYAKAIDIEFEEFSHNSLIVRSVPLWMNDLDEVLFLQDILDMFKDVNDISKIELNKDKIATMACHSSIRFNRFLTQIEMEKVIVDLKNCKQPFNCPHGRPTFICISEKQIVKDFKR